MLQNPYNQPTTILEQPNNKQKLQILVALHIRMKQSKQQNQFQIQN